MRNRPEDTASWSQYKISRLEYKAALAWELAFRILTFQPSSVCFDLFVMKLIPGTLFSIGCYLQWMGIPRDTVFERARCVVKVHDSRPLYFYSVRAKVRSTKQLCRTIAGRTPVGDNNTH